ncbi:MAG: phospho-sugar mutase [bacterium]|nr:phospho-sugar mutase [bacterium]
MDTTQLYNIWLKNVKEPELISELKAIKDFPEEISDRFYKDLEFGTAGLRSTIGAGTNRMNVYTVSRTTQGVAQYLKENFSNPSVAIAYDSRIKSDEFARAAADVLAANGIKVYIYSELMPTPMLSYAVKKLSCSAGIVITASHNPAAYNGYKAYGPEGYQLTLEASERILSIINSIDIFNGVKHSDFDVSLQNGIIEYISNDLIKEYLEYVKNQCVSAEIDKSDFRVVYTPLNGTGNKPVRAILDKIDIKNIIVVAEQELPDGNFPTAPYPNPEIKESYTYALKLAEKVNPDILLATDPDCDRVGVAVKSNESYTLLNGNEIGSLLINYLLKRRKESGTLPKNPIIVKTVVSSDQSRKIAAKYGCEVIEVLTGFKYIGEQIELLSKKQEQDRFILGYEESYGYLVGTQVRDKDAVVASMLICEMACYYKKQGKTLLDVLEEINKEFGYYLTRQLSFTLTGESGMQKMKSIMENLRNNPPQSIAGYGVTEISDYMTSTKTCSVTDNTSTINLPKSDVLQYKFEDGSVIIRPSGTEPKIKIYLSSISNNKETALTILDKLADQVANLVEI